MELGKPSAWSISAWIALVAIGGYLAWSATSKSDNQNYTRGAQHVELTIAPVEHNYPLALPRCGKLFSIDPSWVKSMQKENK